MNLKEKLTADRHAIADLCPWIDAIAAMTGITDPEYDGMDSAVYQSMILDNLAKSQSSGASQILIRALIARRLRKNAAEVKGFPEHDRIIEIHDHFVGPRQASLHSTARSYRELLSAIALIREIR